MVRVCWVALISILLSAQEKIILPDTPEDLERGKRLYTGACTYCHGPTGDGGKGADLARAELSRARTDEDLVRIIEAGIPGTEMPGAYHLVKRELAQVAAYVRTLGKVDRTPVRGDPRNGKVLYGKHGCAACHTIREGDTFTGGFDGPDLSSIGLRRNPSYLRQAITDPGASLPENYFHYTVTLKSGKKLEGRKVSEDTFTFLLRDSAAATQVIQRSNIQEAEWLRDRSPMPSYKDQLAPAALDDLVAYLVSLKEVL